jgi:hypothetical protein
MNQNYYEKNKNTCVDRLASALTDDLAEPFALAKLSA